MQVGIFSDVHGNLAALLSVWNALAQQNLESGVVLNAGDNVGYGSAAQGCISFLRDHPNVVCVAGNYDRHVAQFPDRADEYRRKWGKARPPKFAAIQHDSQGLSPEARAWLRDLPKEQAVTLEGTRILLTHYSPGGKEGLGTWTPDRHLERLAALTDAQVVVCGHTHTSFVRRAGNVLFVNPGTVGRGWHRRASYAVLTVQEDAPPSAHLHQVSIP